MRARLLPLLLLASALCGFAPTFASAATTPEWLLHPRVFVAGNTSNQDCRTGVCKHNENTDLIRWRGATWLVHRTAGSQVLGPNSSLRVYRSTDGGRHYALKAIIPAPSDRDIRDPSFFVIRGVLHMKAITRTPGFETRDRDAHSVTVETHSTDGVHWSHRVPIAPEGWGFWRVKQHAGVNYAAAYEDGDLKVVLYRSIDGRHWTAGPTVYDRPADTPLETELVFSPSGRYMLGLVRMDGNDAELYGGSGRLRTKVCWARAPFKRFSCPQALNNVRLDGAVAWWWKGRLFVLARKHVHDAPGETNFHKKFRKRTALYELKGNFEGGPLRIVEYGVLPSAGDTSYAGVAPEGGSRFAISWYSSPPAGDPGWFDGFGGRTDIWIAGLDLSRLGRGHTPIFGGAG